MPTHVLVKCQLSIQSNEIENHEATDCDMPTANPNILFI